MEILADSHRVGVLLKEPRRTILTLAERPVSIVDMAERLDQTRQRLGYHVRCLVDAGLLEEVEVGRQGAMIEKRYRASAASYALAPELLGPLAARVGSGADAESIAHLLGAVHEVQTDVARAVTASGTSGDRVPTLTLSTRIRLRDARQRAAFADALVGALTRIVGAHASAFEDEDGDPGEGEPFRLTLTLNPTSP